MKLCADKEMKLYIRKRLDKLKFGTPEDVQIRTIYSLYIVLEARGYTDRQIKISVDEVIGEKLVSLNQRLVGYRQEIRRI